MAENETMLETMQRLSERHDRKKEVRRQRDEGEIGERRLLVKRTPEGLYFLKYEGGGQIPPVLDTWFTSINKLRAAVINRYKTDSLLKFE